MLAIIAAVLLAAAPQLDTVFTADGGRLVGTVVEEGPQGVAVQLPDGTQRRLPRREVLRVEYADGSVSTSRPTEPPASPPSVAPPPPTYTPQPPAAPPQYAPPPPAQPPPQYTPQPPAPPPQYAPQPPAQPPAYAPPPPPQAYPPPPYAYGPPRRPPPPAWADRPQHTGPISPFWLSFGIGGLFLSGDAEPGIPIGEILENQVNFGFEGGLRLSRHLGLVLYGDFGVGEPGRDTGAYCDAYAIDCTASTSRVGLMLRHTFDPAARVTPWIGFGTGLSYGSVNVNGSGSDGGGMDTVARYSGWEMIRLQGGIDVRSNPVFGVGFYGGVSLSRFGRFENSAETVSLGGDSTHTAVEAGVRLTLFP